jgi:hypothetical protein
LGWALNLAATSLLLLAGCERFAHKYDYGGTLLHTDGTPAAGEKVSVLPWERFYRYEFEAGQPKRIDELDEWATVTDQQGRFSGSVNGETTYLQWLCLPVAPAPRLTEIYVWVHDASDWSKITVPLGKGSQERDYSGGRHLELPPLTMPSPTTPQRGGCRHIQPSAPSSGRPGSG